VTLSLALINCDALANGAPTQISLDRRGAVIGRSPTVDWSLPDPACVVSSRHCEISFRGDSYLLADTSTNGTLINGRPASREHILRDGDVVTIGNYEVRVALTGAAAPPASAAPPPPPNWQGWDSHVSDQPVGVDPASWDKSPARAAISGMGSMSANLDAAGPAPGSSGWGPPAGAVSSAAPDQGSGGWGAPAAAVVPSPAGGSPWGAEAAEPQIAASDWSSPASAAPAPASADDIWGRLAEVNTVDWARSGFGVAPPAPPAADPLGLSPPSAASLGAGPLPAPPAAPVAQAPVVSAPLQAAPAAAAPAAPVPAPVAQGHSAARLFAAAGLGPDALKTSDEDALAAAGQLLRGLVAGLVVMLEARARAKGQMGAQSTALEFDGNNPLKFARSPEGALAQLLGPPERGFMGSERAVEDAFFDLQSHQMATLKAMQGALKATLDRFSPGAIRQRTEANGLMAKVLPAARDAALWRAYEKEFGGVAQGSDEAFMDVFAKEFRKAYEEQAAKRPRGR
jgi:type VI secretion system protein